MSQPTSRAPKHAPGAPRMPFALLVLGLIVGSMCALLALNTASAANEVQRHNLAVKDAAVADSLVQLNNDVNDSAAPQNLAAAAAALGMVPANNPAFLVIGADGKVRIMGSPGAVTLPPVPVATPTTSSSTPTTSSTPTSSASKSGASKSGASSSSTTKTGTPTSSSAKSGSSAPPSKTKTPSSTPTPTPTPTPNTTLPGGPR